MVPKPKQVERTRIVPKLVDVPRMAPYFQWKQWDWQKDRTLEEHGTDFSPHFPADDAIGLGKGLKKGEKERELRTESYRVELALPDGGRHPLFPPSRDEFVKYANATVTLRVHRYGSIEVVKGP